MSKYMVLNDNETYTDLKGCKIVSLSIEIPAVPTESGWLSDLDAIVKTVASEYRMREGRVIAEFATDGFIFLNG